MHRTKIFAWKETSIELSFGSFNLKVAGFSWRDVCWGFIFVGNWDVTSDYRTQYVDKNAWIGFSILGAYRESNKRWGPLDIMYVKKNHAVSSACNGGFRNGNANTIMIMNDNDNNNNSNHNDNDNNNNDNNSNNIKNNAVPKKIKW